MSKEFIVEKINEAHAMIDEGYFDEAVERLKNIRNRIHETVPQQKIKEFIQEHDATLSMRIQEIKTKSADPMLEGRDILIQKKLYAQTYLQFFSELIHHYDF